MLIFSDSVVARMYIPFLSSKKRIKSSVFPTRLLPYSMSNSELFERNRSSRNVSS
jgi:hypothetical protein